MGCSGKGQVDGGGIESEGKKWVLVGIPIKAPLRKIKTTKLQVDKKKKQQQQEVAEVDNEEDDQCSTTTPTAKESRIPEILSCPPAPRKKRTSSRCNFSTGVREFFTPPDLDSVFIRHVET